MQEPGKQGNAPCEAPSEIEGEWPHKTNGPAQPETNSGVSDLSSENPPGEVWRQEMKSIQ